MAIQDVRDNFVLRLQREISIIEEHFSEAKVWFSAFVTELLVLHKVNYNYFNKFDTQ